MGKNELWIRAIDSSLPPVARTAPLRLPFRVYAGLGVALCVLSFFATPALAGNIQAYGSINSHGLGPGSPSQVLDSFNNLDVASANTLDTVTGRVDFTNGGYATSTASAALGELHVYSKAYYPTSPSGYSSGSARASFADEADPYPGVSPLIDMPFQVQMYLINGTLSTPKLRDWRRLQCKRDGLYHG